ncbi:hypothetical protein J3R83DRAFT_264, partial [Lanmaoa asiatica]
TKASNIANFMQHVDSDLMEKFRWFRILIIGRENAGKNTILQNICNLTEDLEIYDAQGQKIQFTKLRYTKIHDINYKMIFKSNQRFIFHDSPGFETGYEDEFEKMKIFIIRCASTTFLKKQVHAIW